MAEILNLGYFDSPEQDKPKFNPCASAKCPACGEINGGDVLYRSMMPLSGLRSYFFAYHKTCAGNPKIDQFEEKIMGDVFGWDDEAQANESKKATP